VTQNFSWRIYGKYHRSCSGKILPDVPTAAEAGYKLPEFDGLNGILGPRDMPQAVRDRIAADVREAVADPDLDSKLSAVGQVFNPGTSAEFTQAMDDQLKTVKRIGDTLGIKPASAEVSGAQPGETIGAKTAQ
jgi:tripartite-type tricarboxylate transporter receptor subunit TctC